MYSNAELSMRGSDSLLDDENKGICNVDYTLEYIHIYTHISIHIYVYISLYIYTNENRCK